MAEPAAHGAVDRAEMPPAGFMAGDRHVFPLRVYYEDTDAAGIVYYANYLNFVERARTEMMRQFGASHSALREAHDMIFIVRRCTMDFLAPARLDDRLEVRTRVLRLGGATVEAEQIVVRRGQELVRVRLQLACIARSGRPVRLPDELRSALAPLAPDPTGADA